MGARTGIQFNTILHHVCIRIPERVGTRVRTYLMHVACMYKHVAAADGIALRGPGEACRQTSGQLGGHGHMDALRDHAQVTMMHEMIMMIIAIATKLTQLVSSCHTCRYRNVGRRQVAPIGKC